MTEKALYNDNTIHRLLDKIKMRPGIWLGTPDIRALKAFTDGYTQALSDAGLYPADPKTTIFPLDLWFMHEFAKIKTGSYESTAGWANLILDECGGDGKKALKRFFEYYEEFLSLKAVSMKKAVLSRENINANDNMLFSGRKYESPQAVYIIELSGGNGYLCAVETAADIQLARYIFREDKLSGENRSCESPENVFGTLTVFTEVPCADNPDFDKPARLERDIS